MVKKGSHILFRDSAFLKPEQRALDTRQVEDESAAARHPDSWDAALLDLLAHGALTQWHGGQKAGEIGEVGG